MVRHSALTSMFKFVIAMLTALVFVGIGGVTVSAGAHDCGCQTDNSGPGSSGPDNSGPGNACHDNSGPGSTTSGSSGSDNSGSSGSDNGGSSGSDNSGSSSGSNTGPSANSGPGNAEDDCPVDEPDDGGDSSDPGTGPSTSGGGSGGQSAGASTVVLGAQASTGTQVPTAVNAGLTDSEESPSALAALAILLGLAMTFGALARRRTRV